jgi:Rod binding domain-containing protein
MQISPVSSSSTQNSGQDTKLKTTCQEFAAVLWSQLLDTMQETVPQDGVLGDSLSNDIFQSMLDDQYSSTLAGQDSSPDGLTEILYRQMSGQSGTSAKQNSASTAMSGE